MWNGVSIKDYSKGLEILGSVSDSQKAFAKELVKSGKITVALADTDKKIYIKVQVFSGSDCGTAIIEDKHSNITSITLNNTAVFTSNSTCTASTQVDPDFYNSSIKDIITTIENLDYEDTKYMLEGIKMNMAVAELGLSSKLGIGVGFAIKENMDNGLISKDLPNLAMMLTAAASDARMSGITIPVMSSNGSGNNGLTAILPIAAYNKLYPTDNAKLSKALAISHVITSYIKYYIGRLSPLCGCAIAASTGSACAISWLMGGTTEQIQGTVKNILANQSGVICDGAKPGCALKLGTAAASGVQASMLALHDFYSSTDVGIVTGSAENSIKNLKILSECGMQKVDKTIIDIMAGTNLPQCQNSD